MCDIPVGHHGLYKSWVEHTVYVISVSKPSFDTFAYVKGKIQGSPCKVTHFLYWHAAWLSFLKHGTLYKILIIPVGKSSMQADLSFVEVKVSSRWIYFAF